MQLPPDHLVRRRFRLVSWYNRVLSAINAGAPFLVPTQKTNLALLVSAILKKRTLRLSYRIRLKSSWKITPPGATSGSW
jgi:hypothetical protein